MTTQPRRWHPYIRVSTEDQATHGASLDAQRAACLGMAAARSLAAGEVMLDDQSGANLDRPGLQRLLALVERDQVAGIIVWRLDRLTRSLRDLLDLVERCGRHQCALLSCHEMIDTSGPQGRLFLHLLGAFAEFERETIRQRTLMGMHHRMSQGGHMGRAPAGTRAIRGSDGVRRLERHPDHALAVAACWPLVIAGKPLREVADHLTQHHVPTPSGKPWATTAVSYLIASKGAVGLLVDQQTQAAAVAALAAKRRPGRPTGTHHLGPSDRVWRLQGLAHCHHCGSALVGTQCKGRSGLHPYLRCTGRVKRGRTYCPSSDLPAQLYEDQVVQRVAQEVGDGATLRAAVEAAAQRIATERDPLTQARAPLALERDGLRGQIDRLLDLATAGATASRAIAPRLMDLQTQVDAMEVRIADIDGRLAGAGIDQQQVQDMLTALALDFRSLPDRPWIEQQAALAGILRRCLIGHGAIKIELGLPPALVRTKPALWLPRLDSNQE